MNNKDNTPLQQLQDVLHSEIPLTRQIGITVEAYDGNSLTLAAPLEPNVNHKCTAFGGSLYSVSVLSGWGLIYLLMQRHGLAGHIVIQESRTQFIKPVTTTISATCAFESEAQAGKFIQIYRRKGLARIELISQVRGNEDSHVVFTGRYVVHR